MSQILNPPATPSATETVVGARMKVAVAGATGFVGKALLAALTPFHDVTAFTRHEPEESHDPHLTWRRANLFSLLDVERGLYGADVAFYLVHSMLPSARMSQGKFEDFDLCLADTFARGAQRMGVKRIIYLGGLIPQLEKLSPHLESRKEVEEALGAYGVPVTAVRASLVIGPNSSSFRIVEALARRLPLMLTPPWAKNPTQPIDVRDLVVLLRACLEDASTTGRVVEVGGPSVVTYGELLKLTARELGRKPTLLPLPVLPLAISKLWVSLISQTPLALVGPLVESLRHAMVVHDGWLQKRLGFPGHTLHESISNSLTTDLAPAQSHEAPAVESGPRAKRVSDVRSIQRLPMPKGWHADDATQEYLRWLPRFLRPFLRVDTTPERFAMKVVGLRRPLLELTLSPERSTPDRQLLYISGGLLVAGKEGDEKGRLELREVLRGKALLSAIHGFRPSLPWLLYSLTQAVVHRVVMKYFGKHLARLDARSTRPRAQGPVSTAPALPSLK